MPSVTVTAVSRYSMHVNSSNVYKAVNHRKSQATMCVTVATYVYVSQLLNFAFAVYVISTHWTTM